MKTWRNLSAEYVRGRLDYDPISGLLKWKECKDFGNYWNSRYVGTIAGTPDPQGYICVRLNTTAYLAHRLIWLMMYGPIPEDMQIDHIDRDPSNNKLENLRLVTCLENNKNKAFKTTKTNERYIYFDERANKHIVRITVSKANRIKVGSYKTLKEAILARDTFLLTQYDHK